MEMSLYLYPSPDQEQKVDHPGDIHTADDCYKGF